MELVNLIGTAVLGAVAQLRPDGILQGAAIRGRMSTRRQFPQVDFYGDQPMACGLLGHRHPHVELAVVTHGELNVGIGESLYHARCGDWLVFPGNVIHGECALPARSAYQLLWMIGGARGLRRIHLTAFNRQRGYHIQAHHTFESWPVDLRGDWASLIGVPWSDPDRLRLILARQTCGIMTQLAGQTPVRKSAEHPLVRDVKQMLQRHKGKRPTVVELANAVGLSPNYLSNLFHRETRVPLHLYIDQLRIERAKELLSSSTISVKEVAFALNFADPQHFSRVFRRVTGQSPGAFRRGVRG